MFWQIFAVGAIGFDTSFRPQILEFVTFKLGESPFLGNEDLLTSGKLEFGPPEGFNNGVLMSVVCSDGHEGLSNAYTSHSTLKWNVSLFDQNDPFNFKDGFMYQT